MERTSLVLGAGGSIGWVYHLGVLEGVQEAIGLSATDAVRVIGTSAGASIAASVLSGATTDDVLAAIAAPIAPEDREQIKQAHANASKLRFLRPQAPGMVFRGVFHAGLGGLVGLLPAGIYPTVGLSGFPLDPTTPWPENLWVTAVRLGDGTVEVFGQDKMNASPSLLDAVEASSAVPAMFQPKQIAEHRYLDGAVGSSTHAHLAAADKPELVIVAAPMARPGRSPVRFRARRQLKREVATLRATGATVVALRPDEAIMDLAEGYPRHRLEAGPAIVAEARRQTVTALAAPVATLRTNDRS